MTARAITSALAAVLITGCDAAENVRVQPLPSLEALTPEARAGLPEIAGLWQFAGWELAPGDTARVAAGLPAFGSLLLETQRLDSIAGFYGAGEGRMPVVGEVRRDSVLALAGGGRYLTGRVSRDTLWLVLTSLVEPGGWPDDARAAFVRSQVASRFVRVRGAVPALAAADSAAADTTLGAPGAGLPPVAGRPARPASPATGDRPPSRPADPSPRAGEPAPPQAAPAAPPERTPEQAQPERAEPAPTDPEPAEPEPPTRRERPRLLGVPVDSSSYSPTAARAIERPSEVSASR